MISYGLRNLLIFILCDFHLCLSFSCPVHSRRRISEQLWYWNNGIQFGTGMRCRNADSGDIGLDADAQFPTYAFKKEEFRIGA
jgi:hypothetical protein